ncbi:hypothetical protein V7166_22115, partial [Bacillus thuringiensis]
MKELVYLDKDVIHSFIAQINNELIGTTKSIEVKENTLGQQYSALKEFEDYLHRNSSLVNFNEQKDSEELTPGTYVKFTSSFQ